MKRKLILNNDIKIKLKKIREMVIDTSLDEKEAFKVKAGAGCGDYCRNSCSYYCEATCAGSCRFNSGDHACAYKSVAPYPYED